jgi:hypothetical protein
MDGSRRKTEMISTNEFLTVVKNINRLVPEELVAKIANWSFRAYRPTYQKGEIEALIAKGKLLITVSRADHFVAEGIGMWTKDGAGSWLVSGVEEEDVINTPFRNATFGLLPTTDAAFRGIVHSGKEGRQCFTLIHLPEVQHLYSDARGPYLLAGSTSDDQDSHDFLDF